jgi:hypothetical protein
MVPTLTVFDAYNSLTGAQANVRRFAALGGEVALGSDYTDIPQNNFPHFELGMPMHEIECLAGAGLSAMQIIVVATRNAAREEPRRPVRCPPGDPLWGNHPRELNPGPGPRSEPRHKPCCW